MRYVRFFWDVFIGFGGGYALVLWGLLEFCSKYLTELIYIICF